MKIVVLKFGGTSVGTIEKIKKVTDIIIEYKKKKNKVIVVSSNVIEFWLRLGFTNSELLDEELLEVIVEFVD